MCWKRPEPPPGAARPSGSRERAGPPLLPVTQATRNVLGLNGPCVKLLGGGQSPRTPSRQARAEPAPGPEQGAAPSCAHTDTQSLTCTERSCTDSLPRVPSHPITHTSHTHTPQPRPRAWPMEPGPASATIRLTHGQLRLLPFACNLLAGLKGQEGLINPIFGDERTEAQGQRQELCPRRS